MYSQAKETSYIGLPTTNNIRLYKDTAIDGYLATGNATINGDLAVPCKFTYTGDVSYTKPEIDDRFDLKINASLGNIFLYAITSTW